jgi:pre-rRNA-processing protein TSR3
LTSFDECSGIRLYVYRMHEDSPEKSTAMKLVRMGLASRYAYRKVPSDIVILDPFSKVVIHEEDNPKGILVVDRSWKKLLEDKKLSTITGGICRRLPALKAANPINYSKLFMLSSAEALAASLYIIGCESRARQLLGVFKWGEEFFRLNNELLNSYSEASTREELLAIEKRFLEKFYEGSGQDN